MFPIKIILSFCYMQFLPSQKRKEKKRKRKKRKKERACLKSGILRSEGCTNSIVDLELDFFFTRYDCL